jgi:ubiquinol-cytochrome c reductase cytochrome c subunit
VPLRPRPVHGLPRRTAPGTARALAGWAGVLVVAAALLAPLSPAAGARTEAAPEPAATTDNVARGEVLYAQHCATCHGGDGRGGLTIAGLPAPALDPERNERVTVAYTRLVMDTGRMPPAGDPADNRIREVTLEPDERAAILAFMADRFGIAGDLDAPEHGDVAEGLRIYAANCAACHGASGAGGVAGGGAWTPRVNDVTAQTLADAVRTGPFQMPRFDAGQITDDELGDVAAFLAEVEEEGGTLLFPGELNPVFASGFGAGLAAVIIAVLVLVAGKPTLFPDPDRDAEDAPRHPPRPADDETPEERGR